MTTRKNNNRAMSNNTRVRNASKNVKRSCHTFNAVARAFQESKASALGRELLKSLNTLGIHTTTLANLKASDIFTAWWGGLKTNDGNLQMWKSVGFQIEHNGKDYTLYTLKESGDYSRVSVYEKRTILSETDKDFDRKKHIAPTTDVVADGLAQCALCDTWATKVAKATAKANAVTVGYINLGTSQKPEWTKVIRKDGRWLKSVKKAA